MQQDDDRNPSTVELDGTEGCPVFTSDNKAIGHVKEVVGGYFKVNAPRHSDYWLSKDQVQLASANQVILTCPKEEIERLKRAKPGPLRTNKAHSAGGTDGAR
ncbi:MAG: DUF2171 domain-containing protein [Hyphomicrobiales bacterium]